MQISVIYARYMRDAQGSVQNYSWIFSGALTHRIAHSGGYHLYLSARQVKAFLSCRDSGVAANTRVVKGQGDDDDGDDDGTDHVVLRHNRADSSLHIRVSDNCGHFTNEYIPRRARNFDRPPLLSVAVINRAKCEARKQKGALCHCQSKLCLYMKMQNVLFLKHVHKASKKRNKLNLILTKNYLKEEFKIFENKI